MLAEWVSEKNSSWDDDIEFVRKLYTNISSSEVFLDYMAAEADSYEDDREAWRKFYKQFVMNNDDLDALLEEKSL